MLERPLQVDDGRLCRLHCQAPDATCDLNVMYQCSDLSLATRALPACVARPMRVALDTGGFRFGPKSYENDLTVCPITAAAKLAGVWSQGAIIDGHPDWGTPDGPSEAVEDFAAYFDLCCEGFGLDAALETAREALDADEPSVTAHAA